VRLTRGEKPRRENLKSAPGMKKGREGQRERKPSRGWETLKAERSGGWHSPMWSGSLWMSCAKEEETP
jgi:hypothetical protein